MPLPDRIPIDQLGEPFYNGSVQRLYAIDGHDGHMVTETTNRGSVFDVGSIFDIPGSDVSRAVFRHMLYSRMGDPTLWQAVKSSIENATELDQDYRQQLLSGILEDLCANGASTHHGGMIDSDTGNIATSGAPANASRFNVVRRYQIMKPEHIECLGAWLYDYSEFSKADGFVVPLEYIVRFGITGASSVFRKYLKMNDAQKAAYQQELGASKPLEAWQLLERPISDCTTKFEPEDRNISKQEALTLCGLSGAQFDHSMQLAVLGAWAVRHLLEEAGLLLWDIKWEFAKDGDQLVFVDTIDTDSFRATRFFERGGKRVVAHFNKQSMRDYYKLMHGDWLDGVNAAKKRSNAEGTPFTELLAKGQADGTYPKTPEIPEDFLNIQVGKMDAIQDYMLGRTDAAAANSALESAGNAELDYYERNGKIDEFVAVNGVG
ncbi:MAG: phosphoribosylaminoimidazole-succinocarboxamide synthase [Verrucomicrobiales bacterium]|jgi:phosphoribosylaminoimidazole-succinocarboxamide synthase